MYDNALAPVGHFFRAGWDGAMDTVFSGDWWEGIGKNIYNVLTDKNFYYTAALVALVVGCSCFAGLSIGLYIGFNLSLSVGVSLVVSGIAGMLAGAVIGAMIGYVGNQMICYFDEDYRDSKYFMGTEKYILIGALAGGASALGGNVVAQIVKGYYFSVKAFFSVLAIGFSKLNQFGQFLGGLAI